MLVLWATPIIPPDDFGVWDVLEICLRDLEMANLKEQHLDSLCKDWQVYFCSQAFL